MARRSIAGVRAVFDALDSGRDLALVLTLETSRNEALLELLERVRAKGIPIRPESEREMRRMSPDANASSEVLALEGPRPAEDLASLMKSDGIVFALIGLRYPGNVGFILRSVEVAGGAGVVVDCDWGEAQMEEALRMAMHPDRFMSVLRAPTQEIIDAAQAAGRSIVAVETSGTSTPWESGLGRPALVIVGSETNGIPSAILDLADEVVRIPSNGFIPSYNVQAAVGICLGEWLRQTSGNGD